MSTTVSAEAAVKPHERRGYSKRVADEHRTGLLLVLPTVIVIAVVIVFPIIMAIRDSFFCVAGMNADGFYSDTAPFVWFANYASIFTSNGARFWNAAWNTTLFGVVTVCF